MAVLVSPAPPGRAPDLSPPPRRRAPGESPQVVLDLQRLARGRDFLDLGVFEVSPDNTALAYSLDHVGGENYTLYIKNLGTGVVRSEQIDRVTSAAWSADSRELVYTVRDDTYRSYALRRCTLGGDDRLIYEEPDPRFDVYVERSRSGEWLLARSASATTAEVRVARTSAPDGPWTVIAAREPGHLYDVDHAGDDFYVRTNRGAPHFRVVAAAEDDPAPRAGGRSSASGPASPSPTSTRSPAVWPSCSASVAFRGSSSST
ncbi:hypothetical protein [Nannocystis pusilla]|uniref:hypothetical protein n=1 Tax=Nannocystis pusilla TaxID=889268 RepID=UPI003B7B0F9D